jgi:hypothetical protein
MGLTAPLNLPAPGRRQTLYIDFMSLQSPVFLVNSRLTHFTATSSGYKPYRGTPSSEVTGLICRVPKRVITRAP